MTSTTGVSSGNPSDIPYIVVCGSINAQVENLTVIGKQHITITEKSCIDDIQNQTLSSIDLWTHGTVEPSSLAMVLEKIQTGSTCVTITGSPGEGKSTLGFWVLKKLQATRKVYMAKSSKELDIISETASPVVLLDDIFGQTTFNKAAWLHWYESIDRFINMQQNTPGIEMGNLILIGRDIVVRARKAEKPFKEFLKDEHVVNISRDVVSNKSEKLNIWNAIARKYNFNFDPDIVDTICDVKTPLGFPLTCTLFVSLLTKDRRISVVGFFHKPLIFLKRSLKILMTIEEIEHIFVSMIKGNGHVSKIDLARCGSRYIRTANDLCTYIKPEQSGYVFAHPSIFDTVAILLCETKLPFVLEQCSMTFIKERVWLQTPDGENRSDETEDAVKVMAEIPWSEAEVLVERFLREIEAGNLSEVSSHVTWTSDMFVKLLIQSMTADQLNIRVKGLTGFTMLHQLCEESRPDCVRFCIRRGADIHRKGGVDRTALHVAALHGSTDCVRVLVEAGADVNHKDSRGCTALDLATQSGFGERLSSLLQESGAK